MDSRRWQQVKSIFEAAVEQPGDRRDVFLDEACADDAALREEVHSLLAAHEDESPFLEEPLALEALLLAGKHEDLVGGEVGAYRLVRELGHGGMGAVYLAERADGQFEKQVAIKLVHQGQYRENLLERFRYERQILASLQHPNIARLLDGGVTDQGSPYLVMEYVEGLPIDQYCDTHRLSIRERLELFRTVCDAVQYAHQNLVVHRDLKPSNIFVKRTASGEATQGRVKLLDFGIAKLLNDTTGETAAETRTGFRLMTPEYASPEQVRGDPVTTATDVYALGVVLYQLLTGHRPYEVRGLTPGGVERVVCEEDPVKPSTAVLRTDASKGEDAVTPAAVGAVRRTQPERLKQRLRGDLDNIVLKALEKDPVRRYGSVAHLDGDIRRHLMQRPIRARAVTPGYRIAKFVRRHTMGVIATALILLALLGGIITTTNQARIAERRFHQVRSLANTLLFDLHDAIRDLPGATPARQQLVTSALTYLDNLNQEVRSDPSLQLELAEAYEQVGEIQGDPHYTNLGDLAGAMASYQKAFALREAVWQRDPANPVAQHALANSYGHLAVVTSWGESNAEAIVLSRNGLDLLMPLADQEPDNVRAHHDLGRIQSELGWWLIWEGRAQEGMGHLDEAIRRLESTAAREPGNIDLQLHLWRAYSYRIDGLRFTNQYGEVTRLLRHTALPHLQALAEQYPVQPRIQYGLHVAYDYLGSAHLHFGRLDSAYVAYEASLGIAAGMVATEPTNQKAHEALARAYTSIGRVQVERGELDAGIGSYERAADIQMGLFKQNPKNDEMAGMASNSRRSLCRMLLDATRLDEALVHCKMGIEALDAVASEREGSMVALGNVGSTCTYMARIYRGMAQRTGDVAGRRQYLAEARFWYDRAAVALERAKQKTGEAFGQWSWEVHPDSLTAERDAFMQGSF